MQSKEIINTWRVDRVSSLVYRKVVFLEESKSESYNILIKYLTFFSLQRIFMKNKIINIYTWNWSKQLNSFSLKWNPELILWVKNQCLILVAFQGCSEVWYILLEGPSWISCEIMTSKIPFDDSTKKFIEQEFPLWLSGNKTA